MESYEGTLTERVVYNDIGKIDGNDTIVKILQKLLFIIHKYTFRYPTEQLKSDLY